MIKRYPTRKIKIANVEVGGDAPISVQSMTFSKTKDTKSTFAIFIFLVGYLFIIHYLFLFIITIFSYNSKNLSRNNNG
jgi:hypothetical protein